MKHITKQKHFFAIRAKMNQKVDVKVFEKRENHKVWKDISDINPWIHTSRYFEDIVYSKTKRFKCNLAIARTINTDDPWYILTNLSPKKGLNCYSFRYGAIEMLFKSQKSNGFYLESSQIRNLKSFETLYGLTCVAILWMSIIGADYTKNANHYKNKLNITFIKYVKKKPKRLLSMFNLGLTIFNRCEYSYIYFKLKTNFILYL